MKDTKGSVEPLTNIGSAIFRTARLIGELRELTGNGDDNVDSVERISHALDVAAFVIAAETTFLNGSGIENVNDPDESGRLPGWLLNASSNVLAAIKELAGHIQRSGGKWGHLQDSLLNMERVIGTLRARLKYLCCSWILAETILTVVHTRKDAMKN